VWGLGHDSAFWDNATSGRVVFLEDDFPQKKDGTLWYDEIMGQYPHLESYKVHYTTKNNEETYGKLVGGGGSQKHLKLESFPDSLRGVFWDVVIVDAPLGCCNAGPGRYQSIYMTQQLVTHQMKDAVGRQTHVFVDDYERSVERDFSYHVFGKEPYEVLKRNAREGVTANEQAHFIFREKDCIVTGMNCFFGSNRSRENRSTHTTNVASLNTFPTERAQMGLNQVETILTALPKDGNLLVWGLGHDSAFWDNATSGRVVFLEDDFPQKKDGTLWYDEIMGQYPHLESYKVHYTTKNNEETYGKLVGGGGSQKHLKLESFPDSLRGVFWDVVIVDAPLGCCNAGPGRYQSIYMTQQLVTHQMKDAVGRQTHVFVDDYERSVERDFSYHVFGKEPYEVLKRNAREGVTANEQAHFIFREKDCIVTGMNCFFGTNVLYSEADCADGPRDELSVEALPTGQSTSESNSWTVLLTVNDGYYDFFLNWLNFYKNLNLKHITVVVIAEDEVVRSELLRLLKREDVGVPFKLDWVNFSKRNRPEGALEYASSTYKQMVSERPTYILQKLRDGCDIIYSDVDMVWRSSPLPFLKQADIVLLVDDDTYMGMSPYYCTGFFSVLSNNRTVKLMSDWESALRNPELNQPIFNKILHGSKAGINHVPLPTSRFPSGRQYFTKSTPKEREEAVIVHNNYIIGHSAKKERFKQHKLWSLE